MTDNNEIKIDVNKAFEAIARIMSARYNAEVKLISVKRKDETKEDTA